MRPITVRDHRSGVCASEADQAPQKPKMMNAKALLKEYITRTKCIVFDADLLRNKHKMAHPLHDIYQPLMSDTAGTRWWNYINPKFNIKTGKLAGKWAKCTPSFATIFSHKSCKSYVLSASATAWKARCFVLNTVPH
eukprot:95389-Prymnesium_polylepis.2